MNRLEPYEYRPLGSANTIRPLEIEPGDFQDHVVCHVRYVDLGTSPRYEALSYTWADSDGDVTLRKHVSLTDDRVERPGSIKGEDRELALLAITANCDMALRRLRSTSERRTAWIDAICINQRDNKEKSVQVQMMSRIYASAEGVLAYIREHSYDSESLFNELEDIYDFNELEEIYDFNDFNDLLMGEATLPRQLDGSYFDSLMKLLSRPWFERIWILQEATIQEKVEILCGASKLPLSCLISEVYKLQEERHPWSVEDDVVPPLCLRKVWEGKPSPLDILQRSRSCCSTDPRDKVFGICGLGNKILLQYITVDYSMPTEQVYTKIAISILRKTGKVHLLDYVRPFDGSSFPQLPSWVPDWSNRLEIALHFPLPGWLRDEIQPSVEFIGEDGDMPVLKLRGVRVAPIRRVGELNDHRIPWNIAEGPLPVTKSVIAKFLGLLVRENLIPGHISTVPQEYTDNGAVEQQGSTEQLTNSSLGSWKLRHIRYLCRLLVTRKFLGFGPPKIRVGDIIGCFQGADNPHVLRENGGYYEFIGGCHLSEYTQHYYNQPDELFHGNQQLDVVEEEFLIR